MNEFTFQSGPVLIQATKANSGPSVSITLYTGGMMWVKGHGNVVIDLAGIQLPPTVPIITDHQPSIETTLGAGIAEIVNGQLLVQGTLTNASPNAQHILALNKSGLKLQASVGAVLNAFIPIREGQQVTVNCRNIVAPPGGLKLVTKSVLREATICTLGADPETSVSIAASRARKEVMSFEQYLTSLGFDPNTIPENQNAALRVSYEAAHPGGSATATATLDDPEVARIQAIREVCNGEWPDIEARAVNEGWDMRRARVEVIRARRPQAPSVVTRPNGERSSVIEASMLLSQGISEDFVAAHYGPQTVNIAMDRSNRNISLHGLINAVLQQAGRSTGYRRVDPGVISEAFQASRYLEASSPFSSLSLTGALGNVAGKILLSSFEKMQTTWRLFCGITSASNFKPFSSYEITTDGQLEEVGSTGELPSVAMHETAFPNQVNTRGAYIQISEQQLVNDDLGLFAAIPRNFARLSAVGLEKSCYKALLDNQATIFTTQRGNYFEGADSALSIDALSTAERKFLDQVDANGDPLLIMPTLLGVPTSLSATSAVVCRNTSVQQPATIDTPTSTGNPHGDKFKPFVSPWLNNPNMAGASDDHWFLFGTAPETGVITVAFLNNQQQPIVEQGEVDFTRLGIAWRVTYRFGVAVGDHRFGVRAKGTA